MNTAAQAMRRAWAWVQRSGQRPTYGAALSRHIRYSNYVGVAFLVTSLPSVALLWVGAPFLSVFLATACLFYASPLLFNGLGMHRLGRMMPFLAGNIVIFVATMTLGLEMNVQLCLFLMAALPFITFDIREWRSLLVLQALPLLAYVLLATYVTPGHATFVMAPAVARVFQYTVVVSAFAPLSLVLSLFYFQNQRNEEALQRIVDDLRRENSERRRIQTELERARDAAEAATRAKSMFLAAMSHEIRTPMNGVIGTASLLAQTPLDEGQRELVRIVCSSGEFLLGVIDQILEFSRIEAGAVALTEVDFVPEALIADTVAPLRTLAAQRGVTITISSDPATDGALRGDAQKIRHVLTNLIGNAVKFTEAGQVSVRSAVHGGAPGRALLRIEVEDTGIGIDREAQGRIFEPFAQADSSVTRRFGGTGLGLTICRSFVDAMGGTLGLESEKGEGSLFWFQVPVGVASREHATDSGPTVRLPAAKRTAGRVRVLLVEDNVVNRMIASAMLESLKLTVTTAENGAEALERLRTDRFDLVLMDIQMPVMDGLTAVRQMRSAESAGERLPIIGLTAHALQTDREAALAAGMDDCLVKPVRVEALREVVERFAGPCSNPTSAREAPHGHLDR